MRRSFASDILHSITRYSYAWLACILVIIIDQIAKNLVLLKMNPGESIPVLPGILHLTYVQNTGIAFGLFTDANLLFALLSVAIIGFIVFFIPSVKPQEHALQTCMGLLLGGACGNLIDRIFLGFVVDFLDFRVWPVFNVADSAITVAVIGLVFLLWNK